jgi:hypothetical protein
MDPWSQLLLAHRKPQDVTISSVVRNEGRRRRRSTGTGTSSEGERHLLVRDSS